jgi:two-component system chemotaxis response regulator CheY
MVRELLKEIAVDAGWEVVGEAENGEDGITCFNALRPDAITLDLVMPVHDGLYAMRGIRATDANANVIVVSEISQSDVLKEAIALGAADFIVKPFRRDHVLGALRLLGERIASCVTCAGGTTL